MIGAFIKQRNTTLTGFARRIGAIKAGRQTIPAIVAVTGHGCECVIPTAEVEVITPPEEKATEGDFSNVLQNHWGVDTPEKLDKVLTLFGEVWIEYKRLTSEEKEALPLWLGKALAEMEKGW